MSVAPSALPGSDTATVAMQETETVHDEEVFNVNLKTGPQHGEPQSSRCLILSLIAALAVMSLATFGSSLAAVMMVKELHVGNDSVMRDSNGGTVLIGSADSMVLDGVLFPRGEHTCNNATGNCLPAVEASHALATRTAEERRGLSSRIADEVFQNLDRVSIQLHDTSGGNSEIMLRVHGFMRMHRQPSTCGHVVLLDVLHGTVILDDKMVHFDEQLAQHLEGRGIDLSSAASRSIFGRRLESQQTLALGIFSFFEDYECECEGVASPKSPSVPFIATTLQRRPCLGDGMCQSKIFPGMDLPGYDPETDSITTLVTLLVTEDYHMTVEKLPNHPSQELLTLTDHASQSTWHYQLSQEEVTRCHNSTYSPMTSLPVESWFSTYLGEVARESQSFELLAESYLVQNATTRLFRLQLKEGNETEDVNASYLDYEDDASSLLPKRLFIHGARSEGWDVEEVITVELQELDSESANSIMAEYEAMLVCETVHNVPKITTFFEESMLSVAYYVQDLLENPGLSAESDSYWSHALATVDETFLEEYWAAHNVTVDYGNETESSNESRRLRTRGFQAKFTNEDYLAVDVETDGTDVCVSVGAATSGKTPWSIDGAFSMGNMCGSQSGAWTVQGSVGISYTWGKEKKILGVKIGCSVSIGGWIGGTTGCFKYKSDSCSSFRRRRRGYTGCGGTRRLGLEDAYGSGVESAEGMELIETAEEEFPNFLVDMEDGEGGEEEEEQAEHEMPHLMHLHGDSENVDDDEDMMVGGEHDESEEAAEGRRLLFGRRRRSRRRRRTCDHPGTELAGGLGIQGGCSAGKIGVSVSGGFDLNLGPVPQPPLDATLSGSLSAKACVNVGFASGCVSIGSFDLFEIDI